MPNFRNNVSFYRTEKDCGCDSPREMPRRREDCREADSRRDDSLSYMPLAMAYVPWQRWQNILDADKGFHHGTIFQELIKPFERAGGGYR